MSDVMFNGILWASFTFFIGGLFFSVGCIVTLLSQNAGYERGKRDAQPLRASNGWFLRRQA